jgi:hypothetical protein
MPGQLIGSGPIVAWIGESSIKTRKFYCCQDYWIEAGMFKLHLEVQGERWKSEVQSQSLHFYNSRNIVDSLHPPR